MRTFKVLGALNYFLSIEVKRNKHGLHLSQTKYIQDLLFRTRMQECKSSPTPKMLYRRLIKALQ